MRQRRIERHINMLTRASQCLLLPRCELTRPQCCTVESTRIAHVSVAIEISMDFRNSVSQLSFREQMLFLWVMAGRLPCIRGTAVGVMEIASDGR